MIKAKPLLISLAIPLLLGMAASMLSKDSYWIYETITQPPLSPPQIVFPIVWTILYVLMGIASYRIYQSDSELTKGALTVYGIGLLFNVTWTLVFFVLQNFTLAFIWACIIWVLSALTIKSFRPIDKAAAWLMVPYLIWNTFAVYLSCGVMLLN